MSEQPGLAAISDFSPPVDLPALKAHLQQTLTGPTILGSRLGELLLNASSIIERRIVVRKFGGLRKFAKEHLSDLVALKAQHGVGQAEIYEVLLDKVEPGKSSASRIPLPFTPRNARFFWYAISNPLSRYSTAIVENKLICHIKNDEVIGAKVFVPFTLQDYRNLAGKFASQLPSPINDAAAKLLANAEDNELHNKFIPFLRTQCGGEAVQKWDGVRRAEILKAFVESAMESGLNADDVENYRLMLSEANKKNELRLAEKTESRKAEPPILSEISKIQTLALEVIRRMSDEQIRNLNLPFGLVLDAAGVKNF